MLNCLPVISVALVLFIGSLSSAARADALEDDFRHPPSGASTWVYWVWLGTPTTPAAITRIWRKMKAKGIGEFILYDNGAGNFLASGRVDITSMVKPGANEPEIKVVNLWPNRLIGDAALPPKERLTVTNVHHFTKTSQLLPSGLLGPVKILAAKPPN